MKWFSYYLSILCFFCLSLFAEESSDFHFKKITVDDGLSESSVYCIMQDAKGYMWFGTKEGLNRYDGHSFRIFKGSVLERADKHILANNFVRSLIQTDDSTMYIGTDAGLYLLNLHTENFHSFDFVTPKGYKISSAVNALMLDTEERLWIGTMWQGVFVYDLKQNSLSRVLVKEHELGTHAVWAIYKDKSGVVWAGTRAGLLRYNQNNGLLEAIEGIFDLVNAPKHEILSIYEDVNGNLWLGTWEEGLRMYNKQSNTFLSFLNDKRSGVSIAHIRSLYPYSEGQMLVGSDDGLFIFDMCNYVARRVDIPLIQYSLSDQSVYAIAKDREGGIWVGTYFGGVNYLPPFSSSIEAYSPSLTPNSLSGKAVSQFCEDSKGNIWIATEDGGVNYLDTQTKKITQPIKTSYHNTHALLLDGDELWIGTFSRGLDVYNIKTGQMSSYRYQADRELSINDDCVFSLYKTKAGDIYVGTPVGLDKYDRVNNRFIRIPEADGFIYDMKEDDSGNLWLATYGSGVKKLDLATNKWTSYDYVCASDDPIVFSKLTGVYIDSQKRLFFSSEGRGFFMYDYQTDSFKNISEADGLPNNVVYGILDDSYGNLWISTNQGLVLMSPEFKLLKRYNKSNGLQSNQFNFKASLKVKNGKMYFGGVNGFNCFYPNEFSSQENPIVPNVEIAQIKLLVRNEEQTERKIQTLLNRKQVIKLPYDKASLSISYVSLSYVSEENNRYAYRMKGLDDEWNYVENNKSVTYLNLPPGQYLFQVIASNNDHLWNEKGAGVQLIITPPFWLTTPAKIAYLGILLLFIFLLIRFYVEKNNKKQRKYLETFRIEQEALAFKSKIDFFTTIAHEIRTPLSLINAPLEEIIDSKDEELTKQNLTIIDRNCKRLNILIDQLLDFRKMDSTQYIINPRKVDLVVVVREIYDSFKKTVQKQRISLAIDIPHEPVYAYADPEALAKIVGNLLTNAMKFTKDRIFLSFSVPSQGNYVIQVEDNGRGISDQHKELVFDPFYQLQKEDKNRGVGIGLSLVKYLSEALGGSVEVRDIRSGGSVFIVSFSNLSVEKQPIDLSVDWMDKRQLLVDGGVLFIEQNAILIVDDNEEMVAYLKDSLEDEYYVSTANDVHEAVACLDGERMYDLIISDIMMPGIDGIDFTKSLKSNVNFSHIPIVLLSAKTDNRTKVMGLESGADVFIEKPFSIAYLRAQVKSLFKNREKLLESFKSMPLASYSSLVTNRKDKDFFNKLDEEIECHISDETFTVESLADTLGMSRSNLQRKLKSICGVTPGDYLRNYRLRRACELLLQGDKRINEVAFSVGFSSATYFTKAFAKAYDMTPKEFMNKHNL